MGTAYNYCFQALEELPHCADITREYCQKYSGILITDGKYVKVKHYSRKTPVLYGIDYQTHDIPHYILSKSENYQTCKSFFNGLKLADYHLMSMVCDDNINIYQACAFYYPTAGIQLCMNHFKENIRVQLDVRKEGIYQPFMREIEVLLSQKRAPDDFDKKANKLIKQYSQDSKCVSVLLDIARRKELIQGYLRHKKTPLTTNLIESFNSHLQGRLETIKGFESFAHAKLWLNGYFLRRRTRKFTDCTGKFRRLNGKTSLQLAQKPGIDIPTLF